jgi:mannose-6-phosphate isomerase-like protein (cupin superfamily)
MNEELLEITEYGGPAFKPLVVKEGWRVGILNDDPTKYRRESLCDFERHNRTDEVFVLLEGECTLLIGDGKGADDVGAVTAVKMERKKLYNVKQNVWHDLLGSEGMALLVVENADTSRQTSEFLHVSPDRLPR